MNESHWRAISRPIIVRILKLYGPLKDEKLLRKKLTEAYPFGERKYHPYKVWLSEVAYQRAIYEGKKPARYFKPRTLKKLKKSKPDDPKQTRFL